MKPVALVIDDEVQIRRLLRVVLESENYHVLEAETGQQGLMEIAARRPDVILLDLGLPDLEGLEVLKRLREWSEGPVIVLTVRDDVEEKVAALDAGADDYVTKPFSTPELLARLRAAQRKTRPEEEVSVFKNGDLVVDLTARVVTRAGHELKLTATEYALLRLFVKHPGRVLTHRYILREIWGPKSEEHRQYLRVYVTHLRQKIEPDPARPSLIRYSARNWLPLRGLISSTRKNWRNFPGGCATLSRNGQLPLRLRSMFARRADHSRCSSCQATEGRTLPLQSAPGAYQRTP